MRKISVSLKFKAWNFIASLIILIIGLGAVWLRTGDPILTLGILLIAAAFNLRMEPE